MNKLVRTVQGLFANLFVWIFSITCIFPIIWMLYSSLKTDREFSLDILSLPRKPFFENYSKAIAEGNIGSYFSNSMFNTVITVAIVIVISFVTGYCISRFEFKGKRLIYAMFLSGMLIPIYALLIPIFVEFKAMGLLNKRYTLILPYIAFALPVGVFLVESCMYGIPIEIEEAACIDGSSFLNTMFTIVMPMCKPVLSTCAILTFLNTWNEFPLALVLIRSNALKTMPIGLTNFVGSYTVNYPLMLAALVVSTLPVIIMYLLFYNQIMKGMTAGAVKG
ncbi:carbohydrate ABC transporter permease [Lacrimispora sp. 210928-DFI.3.58]|uniref:carbohydrate ABC transporter permease n=1 Tax=Lacrimispora sp. 210928-DFI.3.58 TaxID=2883214 RepID=UPI0015B48AD9|nr:carbohydrate ABC transporter permease [Lacrimispora sp. 210928-DFI.3.58]MCB7318343.1 carbohydrate ABC transporter permease [Lacrimispora sp. 210928-DFI.3.58]